MKIGFIDYYISEWHANSYVDWIPEASEDFCVKYAWAEEYVSPVDNVNTDEWCKKNNVEKTESIQELCEKSDCIVILAPSNPEKHLEYALEALKYGKNVYIDKTFAPSLKEAEEIFKLAEKYNTKFFSTSALRYADELEAIRGSKNIITTGGGSNIEEYIIHQVEMAVKILSSEPVSFKTHVQGNQKIWHITFENGSEWTGIFSPALPFTICGDNQYTTVCSQFFNKLIADMLNFFKTGETSFNTSETLTAMRLRDGILSALKK